MRGQVALEFMAMVGMAGMALLVMMGVAYSLYQDKVEEGNFRTMRDLGYSIQNELILASEVHDGYRRQIEVPQKVGGLPYSIYNTQNHLIINYSRGELLFPIPEIMGSISKGTVMITKQSGVVQVG